MTTPVLRRDGSLPDGDEKRRAVEAMFDRVAPAYDRMNRVISLGLDRRWRRRAVEALGLAPGARSSTSPAAPATSAATSRRRAASGRDRLLRRDARERRAPTRRWCAATRRALPFADGALDGVVCGFALRNFVELLAVLEECARVLRPGGRFAALDAAVPRTGSSDWATRSGSAARCRCSAGCSPATPRPTATSPVDRVPPDAASTCAPRSRRPASPTSAGTR